MEKNLCCLKVQVIPEFTTHILGLVTDQPMNMLNAQTFNPTSTCLFMYVSTYHPINSQQLCIKIVTGIFTKSIASPGFDAALRQIYPGRVGPSMRLRIQQKWDKAKPGNDSTLHRSLPVKHSQSF